LLDAHDKRLRTVRADALGEIAFTDLPVGDSRFLINATGFNRRLLTLTVRNSDELQIDATLDIGTSGTFVDVPPPKAKKHRRWLIY